MVQSKENKREVQQAGLQCCLSFQGKLTKTHAAAAASTCVAWQCRERMAPGQQIYSTCAGWAVYEDGDEAAPVQSAAAAWATLPSHEQAHKEDLQQAGPWAGLLACHPAVMSCVKGRSFRRTGHVTCSLSMHSKFVQ